MIDRIDLTELTLEEKQALARQLLAARETRPTTEQPTSLGQQSLWFVHQLSPDSPAYNFAFAARTGTRVDFEALQRACRRLMQRHDVLRTTYRVQAGTVVQCLDPSSNVAIDEVDVTSWDEQQLLEEIRTEADRPFDLGRGPVFRIRLMRRGAQGDVLSLVVHHIAADLWSMDILIRELCKLYVAELSGQQVELAEPKAQYLDFVHWERKRTEGPDGERSWRYWQAKLNGPLPVLNLPVDHPRPRVQSYAGKAHSWPLPETSAARLKQLARQEKTTLFTTVLSAFQVFLGRYCCQDDVLLGTALANRNRPEWEPVVGYFLNQMVIRADLSDAPTFRQLLVRTRDDFLQSLEHGDYPFQRLVERLHPVRDASRSPLFQVMFIWDKPRPLDEEAGIALAGSGPVSSGVLQLEPLLMEQRGAPFDLTLIVFEVEGHLTLTLRYNVALFDAATIETMAESFQALLMAAVDDPDQPIDRLPLLSSRQREMILVDWNRTAAELPADCRADACVERFAEQTPETSAVVHDQRTLSYAELNQRADQLAHYLVSRGVQARQLVGIHLHRSPEVLVALLAIWRAGAAYLPLDPAYPADRLAFMLRDAAPVAVVTQADLAEALPPGGQWQVAIDSQWEAISRCPSDSLVINRTADDPAYVIYTSGSTGRPKGAVLRHRGLLNMALAIQQTYNVTARDRVLQFASLSFDASIFEIMMALYGGATLCLANQRCLLSAADLVQQLEQQRITIATLPPSVLAEMPAAELPDLRVIVSAGEACSRELIDRWAPGRMFSNAYGPTETTVWATAATCRPNSGTPTIGRPINNVLVYLLDDNLQPVAPGVPAELHIAGPGLSLGYLNRSELTAEKFIPNPYCSDHGAVLYKTGDIARYRTDGRIEFLGRSDHQVKIRGYRIETGEVEAALLECDGVEQCVVVARHDAGDAKLVAYCVVGTDAQLNITHIRALLRQRLPQYMLPAAFVQLAALPLTSNGKVDRAALPAPEGMRPKLQGKYVAPRNEVEQELASIWAQVLDIEKVGVNDNFFDLGGASIQVMHVVELSQRQGLQLAPEMLFEHQTVAELAAAVGDRLVKPATGTADQPQRVRRQLEAKSTQVRPQKIRTQHPQAAPRMLIESLGVYLPPTEVTTDEVVQGCRKPLGFPLERMTGIRRRRMAGDDEFSIDLARQAVRNCLQYSKYEAADIDMLICCNISRCDGPGFQFTYEPTTAMRLKHELGFDGALAFDISNACAGCFTALSITEALLGTAAIRRAMIVSGEYITHLTKTAQAEMDGFMDPRLASLTLGDAGIALVVEPSSSPTAGFSELDMYTLGHYSSLCVAKASDGPLGGAVMLTDPVKSAAVTLEQSVSHARATIGRHRWSADHVQHVIMHQTSETTLDGAIEELNRAFREQACSRQNTIFNVAERGNTASTTHFVALMDHIRNGKIQSGNNIVFGISGSGQTIGTALYTLDDLPDRLRGPRPAKVPAVPREAAEVESERTRGAPRIRIAAVGNASTDDGTPHESIALLQAAGQRCLDTWGQPRDRIDLVLHCGVYRSEFLSEPAVAAMVAGDLKINDTIASQDDLKTFATDVMNGGAGFLNACFLATEMIRSRRHQRALVLASEVENNRDRWPNNLLGIEPAASAVVLEVASEADCGFGQFVFHAACEHIDQFHTCTTQRNGQAVLAIQRRGDPHPHFLAAIQRSVSELLEREGIRREEIRVVLPPQISTEFVHRTADVLAFERQRVVDVTRNRGNLFTSSLPAGLQWLNEQQSVHSGDLGLMISVGAGIQVGCALYYF